MGQRPRVRDPSSPPFLSKELSRFLSNQGGVQKGAILRSFCNPYCQLEPFSAAGPSRFDTWASPRSCSRKSFTAACATAACVTILVWLALWNPAACLPLGFPLGPAFGRFFVSWLQCSSVRSEVSLYIRARLDLLRRYCLRSQINLELIPGLSANKKLRMGFDSFRITDHPRAKTVKTARVACLNASLQRYLRGREPMMRISTSLLALCCQSGLLATLDTPISARSRSNGSRSLRISPLLMARFTSESIAPWI
jgi:hypothetical protein